MKTSLKQNDFDRPTLKKGIEQTKSINRRKISRAIFIDRSPTVLRGGPDLSTYPTRSFIIRSGSRMIQTSYSDVHRRWTQFSLVSSRMVDFTTSY